MIAALLQGALAGDPVKRTTSKGNQFATAQVRVPVGGETIFVGVTAFGATEIERLMRLQRGAAVAAAGVLELHSWVDRQGGDRRDWRLTASEILSVHEARRRRAAADVGSARPDDFDDDEPMGAGR